MMPEKDTRWISRGNERWDPQHIRDKLRSMPVLKKKECKEKQVKGPMVVKPAMVASSGSMERLNVGTRSDRRSPSPHAESPFKQQVVNGRPGSPSSPRISRRRNSSPVNSRPSSPTTIIRRTPSPHSENQIVADEIFKKRVEKALHARLYLLHQIGPKCFLIGGDSPDHKYKVVVGPQTCSCNKGPFCVHVLFVMLRMFQVQENDTRLLCKTLRNYEVEDLVQRYLDRRKGKLKKPNLIRKETNPLENLEMTGSTDSLDSRSSCSSEQNTNEETCPICLLEMIEGESLVICQDGCHNRLHHHCVMIWAENCSKENESLSCPLCRIKWTVPVSSDDITTTSVESLGRPLSPTQMLTANDTINTNVPAMYKAQYTTWTKVVGEDLVGGLFSRDWSLREASLHQISHHIKSVLQTGGPDGDDQELKEITQIGFDIVAVMCEDPVYKVYVSSLKMLRSIISNETCYTENKKLNLQKHLKPVVEAILVKCADSNRRMSQLSVSAIVELCKGQEGELAIGRLIQNPESVMIAVWSVDYFLSTMLVDGTGWQWWLGRLNTINELFIKFPSVFTPSTDSDSPGEDHIITVVKFVFNVVGHTHIIVSKLARRIFTIVTRSVVHDIETINKVIDLMAELEPRDRDKLQKRLRKIVDDFEKVYEKASHICQNNIPVEDKTEKPEENSESKTLLCSCGSVDGRKSNRKSTKIPQAKQRSNSKTRSKPKKTDSETSQKPHLNIPKKQSSIREKRGCTSPQGARAPSPSSNDKVCLCNGTVMTTGDFSDMSMSPLSPGEKPVTFTTEVTTPSHSPESLKYRDKSLKFASCKDKVEMEEAEAIANAMESSLAQTMLPIVPGLTLSDENKDIVIHLRNEDIPVKDQYIEGEHWSRGELIGTGAFSSCYKACDMQTGTIMAVKQVSFIRNTVEEQNKVVDTLIEEISLLSKLDHPNIVRLLGATKHNGHFNMFTEWMPGGSIASILSSFGPFRESVCIGYCKQIFRGLGYLHQKHIIHRDLKGANLLVDSTGQHLRLADFGTAAQMASHLTGAGEFMGQLTGTIAFMAPEVLQGETYGRACDVWSAGCCMIEMMTSKPPWGAADISNHLKLIFKIASANGPPPVPDCLSPAARDLVLRCLETNPKERPAAGDLLLHAIFTRM